MVLALELEGNFQIAAANLGEGDRVGVGWEWTHPLVDPFGGDHRLTITTKHLDSHRDHVVAAAHWAGDHRIRATPKHLPPAEELEAAVAVASSSLSPHVSVMQATDAGKRHHLRAR